MDQPKKYKIYLVEDDEITQAQIEYFLTKGRYEISGKSESGEIAFKDIISKRPNLVLVDINLSGEIDGIELANLLIKEYPCPLIFITSDKDPSTIERTLSVRPYGFLRKPLKYDVLIDMIDLALERFNAENELIDSEKVFSLLVNNLKDYAVFLTDSIGIIINWNSSCERILGFTEKEMLGNNLSFLYNFESMGQNKSEIALREALVHGSFSDEGWRITGKNTNIYSSFVLTPIKDNLDSLKGFSIIIQDITEKKKIEEERKEIQKRLEKYNEELEDRVKTRTRELELSVEEQKKLFELNQVFQNLLLKTQKNLFEAQKLSHIGDWEFDIENKEINYSPEIYNLFEIDPRNDPLNYSSLFALVAPDGIKDFENYLNNIFVNQKELKYDKVLSFDNSTSKILQITIIFTSDLSGKLKSFFGTVHDITERMKTEEEIKNALLKQQELNEIENRFVSLITMEFRNPLIVIESSIQFIERFGDICTEEEKKSKFEKVYKSLKRLSELLDDILEISNIQQGELDINLEEIEIKSFCQDIVDEVNSYNLNRVIISSNHEGVIIKRLDKKILLNIISNLLNNALKYSSKADSVNLNITLGRDILKIIVSDTGIGISEEDISFIFKNFYRCSNVGNIKGTGLGLSIVKEYAETLGGRVEVESILGKGSSFSVIFPYP
jgi:PAS domain S-box-containing protein